MNEADIDEDPSIEIKWELHRDEKKRDADDPDAVRWIVNHLQNYYVE